MIYLEFNYDNNVRRYITPMKIFEKYDHEIGGQQTNSNNNISNINE